MRLASYLDSERSKKASRLVISRGRILGYGLYLVGVVFLVMLPSKNFSRKTFFDENALMTGLVKREFTDLRSISSYAKHLKEVASDQKSYMERFEMEFATLGLEVYSQNFSAIKPISFDSEDTVVEGRNVYAILRAGRAHSTEAIILSAPYILEAEDNVHGGAVMLAMANYFRAKNYWAKDFIFLVTSHGGIGMQAWINQYLGLPSAASGEFGIISSSLSGRSGAIQAVINLEILSPDIQYADIIIEGVNGILPNLDLVNVVMYLCHQEKVKSAFHDTWEWLGSSGLLETEHRHALYTTVAMASRQATGLPQAGHSHFLQHRIDSLTVRGVGNPLRTAGSGVSRDLLGIARALEGTFRSLNNLLETLHHSEFFYFPAAPWHFVSIGLYMPPLAFLLAPLVLEALSQWLQARSPNLVYSGPSHEQLPAVSGSTFPFRSVLLLLFSCYGSGLMLFSSVVLGSHIMYPLDTRGFSACVLLPLAASVLLPALHRSSIASQEWRMVKAMALICSLLSLLALAMMNFPLAVSVSVVITLPTTLAQPLLKHRGIAVHILKLLLILLFCPPLALLLLNSVYLYFFSPASFNSLLNEGAGLAVRGMVSALNSWQFHNCWLFPVMCVGVWPLWLMAWSLGNLTEETHKKKPHVD